MHRWRDDPSDDLSWRAWMELVRVSAGKGRLQKFRAEHGVCVDEEQNAREGIENPKEDTTLCRHL